MSNQRVRVFVKGKVQGVFFRQALKVKAKQQNVFGWVKNLLDGRVEAILEGNEELFMALSPDQKQKFVQFDEVKNKD